MKKHRIAAIINGPYAYGVEARVSRVMSCLHGAYEATMIHINKPDAESKSIRTSACCHYDFEDIGCHENLYKATQRIAREIMPVDIVWLNGDPTGNRVAFHLRRSGTRVVNTACGDYDYYFDTARAIAHITDVHTAMTPAICRKLEAVLPTRARVVHISTGVEIPAEETCGKGSASALLYVGRIEAAKGTDYLIPLLRSFRKKDIHIKFYLAGGGNDRKRLERDVYREGLADSVEFCGFLNPSDLLDLYERCGIYISFSPLEGMSNSLLEAMSYGQVPVVMPSSGTNDLIKDGQNGYIVEQGDTDRMLDRIVLLQQDKELFGRLSLAARKTIISGYSLEASSKAYTDLFDELIAMGSYKGKPAASSFLGSRLDRPYVPNTLVRFIRKYR
ncbi:MAG: glycosyltransferase family 4 protein [bacterium]|nr:glycosyltransferase family 4 protein [bacterium]